MTVPGRRMGGSSCCGTSNFSACRSMRHLRFGFTRLVVRVVDEDEAVLHRAVRLLLDRGRVQRDHVLLAEVVEERARVRRVGVHVVEPVALAKLATNWLFSHGTRACASVTVATPRRADERDEHEHRPRRPRARARRRPARPRALARRSRAAPTRGRGGSSRSGAARRSGRRRARRTCRRSAPARCASSARSSRRPQADAGRDRQHA